MPSREATETAKSIGEAITSVWSKMREALVPIKSDSDLAKRTEILDAMLDKVGEDEDHPLAFICDYIGRLIEEYERKNHSITA